MIIGFTNKNPESLKPTYSAGAESWDGKDGFWVTPLPDSQALVKVSFALPSEGEMVTIKVGEEEWVKRLSNIDVNQPVWGIIDVHDRVTKVEFVDDN